MEIDIKIKPLKTFEITLNGIESGVFVIADEWEGFIKFTNPKGEIIALSNETWLDRFLLSDKQPELTIIKISPDLIPIPEKVE